MEFENLIWLIIGAWSFGLGWWCLRASPSAYRQAFWWTDARFVWKMNKAFYALNVFLIFIFSSISIYFLYKGARIALPFSLISFTLYINLLFFNRLSNKSTKIYRYILDHQHVVGWFLIGLSALLFVIAVIGFFSRNDGEH